MNLEIIGNRYQLLAELGQGGMGIVYRAQDRLTGEHVAIKRVDLPSGKSASAASQDSTNFRLSLAQEFRILSTIRHPNIISVIDYGFDQSQQPYYVMELLTGAKSIADYARNQPLHLRIELLIQTLQAVAFLHRRGVLHRDLKPDNIMVLEKQVRVLDFGLAVVHNQPTAEEDYVAGTIAYMSPEMLMGKGFSQASDLYAFGIVAFEVLGNRYPFNTGDMSLLIQDILHHQPDLDLLDVQDELKAVVGRLLAKDPDQRYQDAGTVIQALIEASGLELQDETIAIRESFLQSARFIGRAQEIMRLTEALQQTRDQAGSLWLIGGESGVGKSRLIEELRTLALVEGLMVLRGQAIVEGGASYLLWRNIMRHLCLTVTLNDLEASVIKSLVPDIAALINRPVEDAPVLDPDAEQTRLLNILEAVFRRHTEPTLIILEDLQWARESLTVISKLARQISTLPLMIVGTFRDDERPELATQFAEAHVLPLKRLNDAEIADLSESILGSAVGRRESVIGLLRMETEGNAFFIVEIVRALAEKAGHLSQIGYATLPSSVFAGGIRAAIQQRLTRVPRDAYAVLEWAAIIGRELDLKFLSMLLPDLQMDQWLLNCSSVLDVQENTWRFAHDKLREAVLEHIPDEQLTSHHAQIAATMEAVYPNDPAYYVRLAYHWREAGGFQKESQFNLLAGKEALMMGNYHEAINFLQRALLFLQNSHADSQQQAVVTRLIGDAYYGLGQLDEAYFHLVQALALSWHSIPGTSLALYNKIGRNALRQLSYRMSRPQDPDKQEADYLRSAASACLQLAVIHYFKNEKFRAVYFSLKGTNLATRAGSAHRDELARLQAAFAVMLSLIPLHRLARTYAGFARSNIPDNNDVGLRSWVLMMSGLYATNTAEWEIAVPALTECLGLAEQAGNVRRTQEALLSLTAVYFFKGEWEKSRELSEKLLESGVNSENLQCQAWGLDDLGRIHYHRGEHTRALELFTRSSQIYEKIGDTSGLIWVNGALAQVYTRQGDLEAARPHAEKVKAWLINTRPGNYGLLEGYQGIADFYLTQYEQQPTAVHRQEAETVVMLMHRFGRIFNTGKAYRHLYESWLAGIHGETQKALRLGKYAMQEARRYELPYEAGLAAFHMARFLKPYHPQRAALLAEAQRIFEQLDASWDAARVNAARYEVAP